MADGYVDLKNIQEEDGMSPAVDPSSDYPYGTQLHLCDDIVTALKVEDLKPGDTVEVRGFATVTGTVERADMQDTDNSIDLQLTSLKLAGAKPDRAQQMYGSSEGSGDGE